MEGTIGEMRIVAYNWAPKHWAICNGAILKISDYKDLYNVIGTLYGGDGKTTFALPNYIARIPMSHGTGPDLPSYTIGQKIGAEQVALNIDELGPHSHTIAAVAITQEMALGCTSNSSGNVPTPAGNYPAISSLKMYSNTTPDTTAAEVPVSIDGDIVTNNTGNDGSHTNIQPFLAMNYVICTNGAKPSETK